MLSVDGGLGGVQPLLNTIRKEISLLGLVRDVNLFGRNFPKIQYRKYKKMRKTIIYSIIVLSTLFLLWNPFTRQILFFILPMGSGIDDLLFVIALVLGTTILTVRTIKIHGEVIRELINNNWKWFTLTVVVLIIVGFLFLQIYPIY